MAPVMLLGRVAISHNKLNVKNDLPVDSFWSISVYDDKGFYRRARL
ncbi:MAG: hypothetical protein ND866_19870 [Pyrinomonadaceae bacterium]|nr:hypothetical protein [Pyrinomonadaceae bacterium]